MAFGRPRQEDGGFITSLGCSETLPQGKPNTRVTRVPSLSEGLYVNVEMCCRPIDPVEWTQA